MIEYGLSIETQYLTKLIENEPIQFGVADEMLRRKMAAFYRIVEVHRTGMLAQEPLTNEENLIVLKDIQAVLNDMAAAIALIPGERAPSAGTVRALAQRYSVNPIPKDNTVEKVSLLQSMFGYIRVYLEALKGHLAIVR